MLEQMPADLLLYWQAYAGIKPFGHEDRLLALIACRLYNATRGEGSDEFSFEDFLPIAKHGEEGDGLSDGEREIRALLKQQIDQMKRDKGKGR